MNKLILAATAACLAASASANDQGFTVTANTTLGNWIDTTSRSLDEAMSRVNLSQSETGVTYVRFNVDQDGTPQNIQTTASAMKPNLNRVGRQAVSKLHALPQFNGQKPSQVFEAAILVADNQQQLEGMLAKVNERAALQNSHWAALGVPNPVVSLAVVGGF